VYQVLSLKHRPKTFGDIVGQSHIVQTLKNEVKYGRIANAYLFAGPRGIGKTTTARILAKALNCVNGPTTEPCGSCDRCAEIQAATSLDVLEIDGASNRGIDEIRQLRERLKYAPSHGKYKIYIIDEVHMLTQEAFNALLKTIEEPPKHVVFIFATTAPYKLPLTILSRCQRFNFRKIRPHLISGRIKAIAEAESVEIEDLACSLIAQLVDGSLRDAISMFDQLVPYADSKIGTKHVQSLLGLAPESLFFQLTDAMIARTPSSILTLSENAMSDGVAPTELVSGLIKHLQALFLIKIGVSSDSAQAYADQANALQTSHLLRIMNYLFDTEKNLRNALSGETYLGQALVRISMCSQVSIDEILGQFAEKPATSQDIASPAVTRKPQEKRVSRESQPAKKTQETPPDPGDRSKQTDTSRKASPQPKTSEPAKEESQDSEQMWQLLRQRLKPSLGSIVGQANPGELNGDELLVTCDNDFLRTKIEENRRLIEEELERIASRHIGIVFGNATPKKNSLAEEAMVQSTIRIFDATISDAKRY
jgi:DNA polymerase-3 subunit gamma/tau